MRLTVRAIVPLLCLIVAALPSLPAHADASKRLAHFDDVMPHPLALPDGSVAAVLLSFRGPGLPPTPPTQTVNLIYSHDQGKTWSAPEPALTLPADQGGFGYGTAMADRGGEIHLFLLCDANTGVVRRLTSGAKKGPSVFPLTRQHMDVWHTASTHGRTQWTRPVRIWSGRAGDLLSVTQLRSGRILLPISYLTARNWRDRGEGLAAYTFLGRFDSTVLYSDDDGKTWTVSKSVLRTPTPSLSSLGGIEPVVAELSDGRVWMLIRTQLGRFYQSFSHDGGATWSRPQPSDIRSCDAPAALVRLHDGRLLMIWNNSLRYPYAQGGRFVLHAAISPDDGGTWLHEREILRDPRRNDPPPPSGDFGVAYTFPTLTAKGRIIYSMWVETGSGRSLYGFDPAWLDQPTQRDTFADADALDAWTVFGTHGVDVTPAPGTPDGHALRLAHTDADWPTAAVRSFPGSPAGRLKLRLRVDKNASPMLLELTDHYSVPFDDQDRFFSVFNLPLAPGGELPDGTTLEPGRWVELQLDWDCPGGTCHVALDGKPVGIVSAQRRADSVCYLRLRSTAVEPHTGALLVSLVEADAAPQPTSGGELKRPTQ